MCKPEKVPETEMMAVPGAEREVETVEGEGTGSE